MRYSALPYKPEKILEMLYHRELGYSLNDDENSGWNFRSAFNALKLDVDNESLRLYRSYFIEHGWAQFSGRDDPCVRLTDLGQQEARKSIFRRRPIYSTERLRTYDWPIFGAAAAIIAALFSIAAFLKAD